MAKSSLFDFSQVQVGQEMTRVFDPMNKRFRTLYLAQVVRVTDETVTCEFPADILSNATYKRQTGVDTLDPEFGFLVNVPFQYGSIFASQLYQDLAEYADEHKDSLPKELAIAYGLLQNDED